MKYLGNHFDIHTGGIDHIPVHHTNEIAQSEARTGEKYVNYWMHVNFLNDTAGKMSKSSGDFLSLQVLLDEGISALAYRYYLLTTHYRAEIAFSLESLRGSKQAFDKLCSWMIENKSDNGRVYEEYKKEFDEFIFSDLGTPQAIALIWKLLKDDNITNSDKYVSIISFDTVLGLGLHTLKKELIDIPNEVQTLLDARKEARDKKDFAESDRLRDEIARLRFIVKDGPNGQEISMKN